MTREKKTRKKRNFPEPLYLENVKAILGRRIELERRSRGMNQAGLGKHIGLGVAWVRNLEGGYPKVRLEQYFASLDTLGISVLTMCVPLLFIIHGRKYPPHLLFSDMRRLESAIIDFVIEWNVSDVKATLARDRDGQ
ncbi:MULTISPECIES: helix-turn-helix domain-containing protein [Sphingobium]|uniref:helix-turn-helix domain-containing protein n=1 Tax=Sphingobium TaxID=165695 RepID=UPI000B159818|nr:MULTISPECIES: helix-turn-helix domain-containing protein [Sphingobium]MDV3482022.1 helix-turn-helix domain-containing protein [Sphingobium yanoikuyae]HUD95148.1 helix-turn-helix domain-containing protein [Sphingobium sp.]